MEPITHMIFGLGIATLSGHDLTLTNPVYIASIAGAIAPDLDILFRVGGELTYLKHHRKTTHSFLSVLFITAIIPLCINMFIPLESFWETFFGAFGGCISHVFLDLLNSYGVKLLWPFSRKSFSLNLLLLYDPIIIMLSLIMFFARNLGSFIMYTTTAIFVIYLGMRYYFRQRIHRYLTCKYRHKKTIKIVIMPSLISLFDWDFLIETQKQVFVGSIKTLSKEFNLKRKLKKHSKNMLIKLAMKTRLASIFKEFTPYFHIDYFKKDGKHYVKFFDLRYCQNKEFLHSATAIFDQKLKLVEAVFHPFSVNRKIKLSPQ